MSTTATQMLWTAPELAQATGGRMATPFGCSGVSIDTRTLVPGDLFVALVGENGDGHAHLAAAFARGAAGALVHRRGETAGPVIEVGDTLAGLRALAAAARRRFSGLLVAVTGSVGKTTTKEMLRAALAALGPSHAAAASHNNHWGVPLTLARLPRNAAFCVVEIGMNHAGEIAPLARLAAPDAGIITGIERTHIGHLGSIEAIADEKASLFDAMARGVAVLPADSPLLPRLRAHAAHLRVVTFGAAGDARVLAVTEDADGSDVAADVVGQRIRYRVGAPGRHMVADSLAALAAIAALGLDVATAAEALAGFAAVAGRGARRPLAVAGGQALLLDESYNASAASVRAALNVLKLQPARRRIAVLGDMLELGADGPGEHVSLAPDVAASADLLFACGPLMRNLFEAIPERRRAVLAEDSAMLAPIVARAVAPGDAILVKGSLGSRMRLVVQALEREALEQGPLERGALEQGPLERGAG